MPLKKIVSFGYKNGITVGQDHSEYIDIRQMFNNPYHNHRLRHLTGKDFEVQKDINKTPGFIEKYQILLKRVRKSGMEGIEILYIGCTGGRHRSVYLADLLAKDLNVEVQHRDLK